MSAFAPVYVPSKARQSLLQREHRRERKRKRVGDSDDDESPDSASEQPPRPDQDTPRLWHPVNKTDPYNVAGHSRGVPLPGGNFPHAAIRELSESAPPIDEQLAQLNPPLYVPKATQDDPSASFKRRHLDNLTAILHKCVLRRDWERASRTLGLILRTEFRGYGVDVRHHGRWMIGAEILMGQKSAREQQTRPQNPSTKDHSGLHGDIEQIAMPGTPDDGFELARNYYERFILQYPHRPQTPHATINALAIYPALFSVCIFEVHDQARRLLAEAQNHSEHDDHSNSGLGDRSDIANHRRDLWRVKAQELGGAHAIIEHMDELMLNPPYDASAELLYIRGMAGLWLSDLHKLMAGIRRSSPGHDSSSDDGLDAQTTSVSYLSSKMQLERASAHRCSARKLFRKLVADNLNLPAHVRAFLDEDDDPDMLEENDKG